MTQLRRRAHRATALAAIPLWLLPSLTPALAAGAPPKPDAGFEGTRGLRLGDGAAPPSPEAIAPATTPDDLAALAEEPPARVGRIARVQGTVLFRAAPEEGWSPAAPNTALVAGNAIYTEPGARAGLDINQISIAVEGESDVQLARLDDQGLAITLPRGALYLSLAGLLEGEQVVVATPQGSLTMPRDGRYQIEAGLPADAPGGFRPGRFAVLSGAAVFAHDGVEQPLGPDQAVTLTAQGPVLGRASAASPLVAWAGAVVGRPVPAPPVVARQMTGAEELARYGRWEESPEYGDIWYPQVEASYVPYREGRWVWRQPWGWTWVDDRPWGFAPFHYGRWVQVGPRWGWAPSPVPFAEAWRPRRPVWAPALVAFVGVAALGGRGPGVGWVPLGPREPYLPAFRASPGYVRNVNVFAVRDPRAVEARWRAWRQEQPMVAGPRPAFFAPPPRALDGPPVNRAAFSAMPAAAMTASQPTRGLAQPLAVSASAAPLLAAPPAPSGQTFGVTPAVAGRIGLPPGSATATPQRPGPAPQTHAPLMAGLASPFAAGPGGGIATGGAGGRPAPLAPSPGPGSPGPNSPSPGSPGLGAVAGAAAGAAAGLGAAALLGRAGTAAARPGAALPPGGFAPAAGVASGAALPGAMPRPGGPGGPVPGAGISSGPGTRQGASPGTAPGGSLGGNFGAPGEAAGRLAPSAAIARPGFGAPGVAAPGGSFGAPGEAAGRLAPSAAIARPGFGAPGVAAPGGSFGAPGEAAGRLAPGAAIARPGFGAPGVAAPGGSLGAPGEAAGRLAPGAAIARPGVGAPGGAPGGAIGGGAPGGRLGTPGPGTPGPGTPGPGSPGISPMAAPPGGKPEAPGLARPGAIGPLPQAGLGRAPGAAPVMGGPLPGSRPVPATPSATLATPAPSPPLGYRPAPASLPSPAPSYGAPPTAAPSATPGYRPPPVSAPSPAPSYRPPPAAAPSPTPSYRPPPAPTPAPAPIMRQAPPPPPAPVARPSPPPAPPPAARPAPSPPPQQQRRPGDPPR